VIEQNVIRQSIKRQPGGEMRSLVGHGDVPSAQSVNGSLPLADGGVSATVAGAALCNPG
jgi:hypothetical protein